MAHDILIVDDEADIRSAVTGILEDEGYECRTAGDSDQALEGIRNRRPSLVMLDIWLQNSAMDGLEILQLLQREQPDLPVVMISGHGTIESAVWAIKEGAYDFIEKPFKTDRMLLVIERALEAARLKSENAELRLRAGTEAELIGHSQPVQTLQQAVQKVAPTGSRVLVTGPAGAGKEVVARMLHRRSRRAAGPFVVLNCAIMHPDRLETELFGVEAEADQSEGGGKVGQFERAHGGTLVLDEVADMPLETQGKIVRVLQDQSFQRVGGTKRVEVDVRVIASSNRDLEHLLEEGRFRQDLYYRLNVVPLRVPSLHERVEDVPALVSHFMTRAAKSAGLPPRLLSDDAMAALQAYSWPGNVRQLRNVIDWLLIMAPGDPQDPIRADMLPPEIGSSAPAALRADAGGEIMSLPLREARELFEKQYLEAQVLRFGGNISRTASFVGMERSALHRKLRSLGIQPATETR
ncbi:nitrogen assimilation response regulator NtrX [Rhodovibrio salinarum]|uniref:Sigma-54-dependent Fis family transcriptional regulator n=1 Tax=Rhodovibrio salinarum TaxID=1087 RepID=A0A934V165_9PROT|nr:sigma-54 dependent transcriptional regulator [Rhodovibrio salinarum]MBK1697859.1 sigma-54-dependent Fis family transcriptional regulator [Rhodovibrio salinarum]